MIEIKVGDYVEYEKHEAIGVIIGDIVELKDGTIGELVYIEKCELEKSNFYNIRVKLKYGFFSISLTKLQFKDYFNRIGNNYFTKKDNIDKLKLEFKKVTEPSDVIIVDENGKETTKHNQMVEIYKKVIPTNEQLFDKINEIIDYINKEK